MVDAEPNSRICEINVACPFLDGDRILDLAGDFKSALIILDRRDVVTAMEVDVADVRQNYLVIVHRTCVAIHALRFAE